MVTFKQQGDVEMNNIDWVEYGTDESYGTKMFKVDGDEIYLSWNNNFKMNVNNFLVCCANVDDIPMTDEHATTEFVIGEDGGKTVSMSLTNNHDDGTEDQVGIVKRDGGKWDSWVRFTLPELVSIVRCIREHQ